jgi:Tfp pilus assembly protein PilE
MRARISRLAGSAGVAAVMLVAAGCGGNPVQQVANTTVNQITTAHRAQVTTALAGLAQSLAGYQAQNGSFPADQTAFDQVPGAQQAGVSITYAMTGTGWCMVGVSAAAPPATVVWTNAGEQPSSVTSCP